MAGSLIAHAVRDGLTQVDERVVAAIGARLERPALLSLLFHGVFESRAELESGAVHPQEAMTLADFDVLFEYFSGAGYRFVSVAEVERGLDPSGRHVCITFDDGYASTARIVELLRRYSAPAAVFVSTGYVESGKRYWWDAVYEARSRRGASERDIAREIAHFEREAPEVVDRHVVHEFGASALAPRGDLDRPLTEGELRALAADEYVTIGNHTAEHVVLAGKPAELVRRELSDAQAYIERTIGVTPTSVSYPEGAHDEGAIGTVRDMGFASAFSTLRRRERHPISAAHMYALGRFQLRRGSDLRRQLRALRSELRLADAARTLRGRDSR
ncbi:MAG: polysaccharide deacetylase family protein [Gaiellaceae bacterium]